MTKGQQEEHRQYIRGSTWKAVEEEVLSGLPLMKADQILHGKPAQEQMALQQAFCSGMIHAFDEILRLGRAPKSRKSQVHARHLLPENNIPQNPNRL